MISFKSRQTPKAIILQCVRWYCAYSLSYRNIEEMMQERGIDVDHSTLNRWVIHYAPLLEKAFHGKKKRSGNRWRMDETYIKVKGQWKYLYRAVDSDGNTIDFLLTAKRDTKAALRFFKKSIGRNGKPSLINIDKSGANTAGIKRFNEEENKRIKIRQNKYMNNIVRAGSSANQAHHSTHDGLQKFSCRTENAGRHRANGHAQKRTNEEEFGR